MYHKLFITTIISRPDALCPQQPQRSVSWAGMRLVLVVAVLPAACVAMCPYIDGHWAVNYMRGQVSPDWWSCSAEL